MKKTDLSILFSLLIIITLGCSDDDNGSSAVANGKITATINGEEYEANAIASVYSLNDGQVTTNVSSFIDINNSNDEQATITIIVPLSPGETETFNLNEDISPSGVLGLSYAINGGTTYTAQLTDGSNIAMIEISEYTENSISGSFSGTLTSASGSETVQVENGSFNNVEVIQE